MIKNFVYKSKNFDYQIEFELNNWAERSLVSSLVKFNDTVILTTVNLGPEIPELDFLPLTIDYEEKFYAVGKIYGSRFVRREGRPSVSSILNARMIDRAIRPLFPFIFRKQIHIVHNLLSYDATIDPGTISLLNTSFSLHLLGLSWIGPVGAVYICDDGERFFINKEVENWKMKMIVSGTLQKINMIELEGKEVEEKRILQAIDLAQKEIEEIVKFIKNIPQIGSEEIKIEEELFKKGEELLFEFLNKNEIDLEKKLFSQQEGDRPWLSVYELVNNETYFGELKPYVINALNRTYKKIFQEKILKEEIRPDGRKLDDIRKLYGKVDVLPRLHGSALFMRGLTHILSTVTLASPGEELWLREVEFEGIKRFIHHYNFPPFSTGEIGSKKSISRREIGHGELAEKALRNLIPSQEEFPYTIRVVSEVLSSNGSTSMGSVCASSMALMSAGVPFKKHVAGISIGMVYQDDENYKLLTDIQGPEDFFGAMDFKIAGTENGVTAIQLDVKIEGLNLKQIEETLLKAKKAREYLLEFMKGIILEPRKSLSPYAPKIEVIKVDPLKIGLIIGTGGRTINEIITSTNVKIDIQPDGLVYIIGENSANINLAKNWIKSIADGFDEGELVKGKVIKIVPFGAILELAPNRTALLHISEIANKKIENIENEIKIGDELLVMIKNISADGKIYVSLKDVKNGK